MAPAPVPPVPYWNAPAPPSGTRAILLIFIVVLGSVFAFVVIAVSGFSGSPGFATTVFAPLCFFFLFLIIVAALVASQHVYRPTIPPPPPIQQPMVPAGTQGPVALACPNCGAPPTVVDRFGVATCPYCNTRFLVR